jgi:hypothetical protein
MVCNMQDFSREGMRLSSGSPLLAFCHMIWNWIDTDTERLSLGADLTGSNTSARLSDMANREI